MARKTRPVERVEFSPDDLTRILAYMVRLADAEDGWINLLPKVADNEQRPTSLGFLTLLSGGSSGVTMCTWIPASGDQPAEMRPTLGIMHVTGRRAVAELLPRGVPVPGKWFVEQDHPRRGLVLRLPPDEALDTVLTWALQAVEKLSAPGPVRSWRADVYLPATS